MTTVKDVVSDHQKDEKARCQDVKMAAEEMLWSISAATEQKQDIDSARESCIKETRWQKKSEKEKELEDVGCEDVT